MCNIVRSHSAAVAAAFAVCFAGSALAADMPVKAPMYTKAPAVVAYSWTGWYAGLNAGWEHARSNNVMSFPDTANYPNPYEAQVAALDSRRLSKSGFTGGIQAGYNWQQSNIVYGAEADFNWLAAKPSQALFVAAPALPAFAFNANDSVSARWLATFRGRAGVAVVPTVLLYATGGLAVANIKTSHFFNDNDPPAFAATYSTSTTKAGWTAGGGAEASLTKNWSVKAEYLYSKFSNVNSSGPLLIAATGGPLGFPVTLSHSNDLAIQMVRAGINYHF